MNKFAWWTGGGALVGSDDVGVPWADSSARRVWLEALVPIWLSLALYNSHLTIQGRPAWVKAWVSKGLPEKKSSSHSLMLMPLHLERSIQLVPCTNYIPMSWTESAYLRGTSKRWEASWARRKFTDGDFRPILADQ